MTVSVEYQINQQRALKACSSVKPVSKQSQLTHNYQNFILEHARASSLKRTNNNAVSLSKVTTLLTLLTL